MQNETDVRGLFIPHFALCIPHLSQDCGVISSISPCEGDGPGANPGFLTKNKMRGERSKRLAYPQADSAPRSNPSPGTMISTPVFGCELFVAQSHRRPIVPGMQRKVIHQVIHRDSLARLPKSIRSSSIQAGDARHESASECASRTAPIPGFLGIPI